MSVTKILVCCHKPDRFMNDDVYMPIHVGKANSSYDLGIQGDDTGDNISMENPHFCELTGLYWAWKNMEPVDYIGLCHYRRYFNFHSCGNAFTNHTVVRWSDFDHLDLTVPDVDKLFQRYDVVLSTPKCYPYSLVTDYCVCHLSEDFSTLRRTVDELTPEYSDAFRDVFYRNNKLSLYNMMIMRWEDFDEYCSWLFKVLFAVRDRVHLEYYDAYQGRIFGYMSERLLSVFVWKKQMRVRHYPVYWINDECPNWSLFNRLQHYVRNNLSFILHRQYR